MTAFIPQTCEDILAMFENIVDDSLDQTLEIQLLNGGKSILENEQDWEYLKDSDESQSFNSGDTYLTMHALPKDSNGNQIFNRPLPIFVGTDVIPYLPIPFEKRIIWQSITHRYYLNMKNYQYAICGSANPGGTIHFYYVSYSLPLAPLLNGAVQSGTINVPLMDKRFIPLLVYYMGMQYFAIDQGEKMRAWDDRWQKYFNDMHEAMVLNDAMLKVQANQNVHRNFDLSKYPNIISEME